MAGQQRFDHRWNEKRVQLPAALHGSALRAPSCSEKCSTAPAHCEWFSILVEVIPMRSWTRHLVAGALKAEQKLGLDAQQLHCT